MKKGKDITHSVEKVVMPSKRTFNIHTFNLDGADGQLKELKRRRDALLADIVSDDFPDAMRKLQFEFADFIEENPEHDTEENRKFFKVKK